MTITQRIAGGIAGLGLLIAPVSASASPVSFDDVRVSTEMNDSMGVSDGSNPSWIVIILGLAAVVGAIALIADDDPTSP